MEPTKKGLKADKKFRDLKIQALSDSSSEDEAWAGLTYAKEQVESLYKSGLSLIEEAETATKAGDYDLAKKCGVRSAKVAEKRQYYLNQMVRLAKILSRKTGKPTIITNSLTRARVYDPGRLVSNKERKTLENGFTNMLQKNGRRNPVQ